MSCDIEHQDVSSRSRKLDLGNLEVKTLSSLKAFLKTFCNIMLQSQKLLVCYSFLLSVV